MTLDVSERYFEPAGAQPPQDTTAPAKETSAPREPASLPRVVTARELCALPDPDDSDMLLGPLVVRGARTIIVADTGHGKTTFALQLAKAILTGGEMLGHDGAGVGPVLVIDLEQGIRSIKRSLRDAGLDDRDDVHFWAVPDGLALDDEHGDHRRRLAGIVASLKPAVLIVDPYYKAHRGDANEERPVVDLMRFLDALRASHGFALILPAHPRKDTTSNGTRKLTLHDVSGSGAAVRGAELAFALERLSHGYARLRILKDRDGDLPVGEAWPLIFTRGEGFKLDPKEEKTAEELEQRVLTDTGEWRTVKEWAADLGIREKRAKTLLEQLVETGRVETAIGPPGRSPRAHCYRTAPEPWAQSGAVGAVLLAETTAPTAPTSIGDVALGAVDGTAPATGAVDDEEAEVVNYADEVAYYAQRAQEMGL